MPSDSQKENEHQNKTDAVSPQPAKAAGAAKAWPFAPGSQLGKQVARPWTPKPSYRFNQR